jgi:hypothetical protein
MLDYILATKRGKILKLKDRLLDPTNDLMINFFYEGPKGHGCIC